MFEKLRSVCNKRNQKITNLIQILNRLVFLVTIIFSILLSYDLGFETEINPDFFFTAYSVLLLLILTALAVKYTIRILSGYRMLIIDYLIVLLIITILGIHLSVDLNSHTKYQVGENVLMILFLLVQLAKFSFNYKKFNLNPPLLFIASFIVLIIIGTGLLLLPNSTHNGITVINALFTSVSAVCVTGLIVVDTATAFTEYGQLIIMILIQLGGLGIMTFTFFFNFFFKGKYLLENQLYIKEFINEDRLGEIFSTLMKIVAFTLLIEITGAFLIYNSFDQGFFVSRWEHIKFAVFHSISAFCNAGFSTFTDGLFDPDIRHNYELQWIIALLIILGGIGFPVIINVYNYVKALIINVPKSILHQKNYPIPKIISINTWIVSITTLILIIVGTCLFYLLEKENTLQGMSSFGKITNSFFGAVTPRTAGFNTINIAQMAVPTLLLYLLFMWIGASPGSTGGGLKTSTFAIAMLTTISISKNKDRLEVYNREIPNESIKRAFTIIHLSFLVIGLAVFLITIFDPEKQLIEVAFECFSAYSTVGLTMGITPDLSIPSKVVIIFTMILGRVGTLTLLIGLIRNVKTLSYQLPKESIFIN